MSDIKEDKPYFAPPAEGEVPEGELPKWGEDAQEIQREAGLGSYGRPELPGEQAKREDALLHGLERLDGELASLRSWVYALGLAVATTMGVITWMLAR